MKYKKLSYIIPSYNAEKFLKETVESVYKQKLNIPFEIIISDDNSNDNTQKIIIGLANKYPEIKYYLNKKNLRAPNNRNFAISKSSGDLIYMLDHDNVLADNTIQKLLDGLNNSDYEIASTQIQYFFKGSINQLRKPWIHNFTNNLFTIKDYIERHDAPTTSGNYLYTKNAFMNVGGYPDYGGRENFGFGFRLVANGFNILIIPNTCYYHRLLENGLWLTQDKNKEQNDKNMIKVFSEYLELFDKKTQKLLKTKNTYNNIDKLMDQKKLHLSNKGWMIAGGKHIYSNKYYKILKNKSIALLTIAYNLFCKKDSEVFNKNYRVYKESYLKNKNSMNKAISDFTLPVWEEYSNSIEKYFINSFDYNFFSNRVVRETMFIKPKWDKLQIKYLEERYSKNNLKKYLKENRIGGPTISSLKYLTSPNTIHHLNHVALFEEKSKINIKDINNVVEWGGGYGNLAKIFRRYNKNCTYTIIDLPIFIYIQAVYLSCIYSKDKINIINKTSNEIKKNKINLIPLNKTVIRNINFNNPDIFISTWAISESNKKSQEYVKNLNYFESRYLLLAHQATSDIMPNAGDIANKIDNYDIIHHKKINYIAGNNYYLFAHKKN
jgi:putative sugar O-methyltransferase